MPVALPALHGAIGAPPLRLVGAGTLHPLLSVTRAQVNARAASLGADGATWQEHPADTARFHGPAQRLLVEGQRTNHIRNPRLEGAVAGSGTLPANWSIIALMGLSRSIVAAGKEGGVDYIDLRIFGVPASTGDVRLAMEAGTAIAASNSQAWTLSCFMRLVGGSLANVTGPRLCLIARDAANAQLTTSSSADFPVTNAPLGSQRASHSFTTPAGSTAYVTCEWRLGVTSGQAVDLTIRIGWPQVEQGSFASAPNLPPEGAPQATTRGADLITSPFTVLFPAGAGTVLWSGVIPQAAPTGVEQVILQVSGASDSNKISLRVLPGSSNVQVTRAAAGVGATATLGNLTPGAAFAAGLTFDGTGSVRACMSGGPVGGVTGAPTSFSQFRLGTNTSGAAAMFGEAVRLEVFPFALSDAALAARVNLIPL